MTNFEWNFHNRGMPRSEPEDKQPFYFRSPSPVAKKVDCRILNSESPLFEFKVAIAIKEYDELKRKLEGKKPKHNPPEKPAQCAELEG